MTVLKKGPSPFFRNQKPGLSIASFVQLTPRASHIWKAETCEHLVFFCNTISIVGSVHVLPTSDDCSLGAAEKKHSHSHSHLFQIPFPNTAHLLVYTSVENLTSGGDMQTLCKQAPQRKAHGEVWNPEPSYHVVAGFHWGVSDQLEFSSDAAVSADLMKH